MTLPLMPSLRRAQLPRQSPRDALVTSLAAGVDRSVMRAVALVVEKQLLPRELDLQLLRESMRAMFDSGLLAQPAALFDFVAELESPRAGAQLRGRATPGRRLRGGRIQRHRLESRYREHPLLPAAAGLRDHTIHCELWQHRGDAARGTVIALHGFAMGWPAVDALALSARRWFALGLDVALVTLPDHGPRRPPGSLFSGQRYTVPHAMQLAGAVHQAVHEIFELKAWLRHRSGRPVGLFGMSLGGYLASLCAGLSADFDFLVPLVPPACMGDLAWRVYRDTGHHRSGQDAVLTEDNMRRAFYVHSPLAHPRRIPRERILLAAGAGDRIVPPQHPTALWQHWQQPRIHWFRGSHVAPLASERFIAEVEGHLRGLAVL